MRTKDEIRAYQREWHQKHKVRMRAYRKAWRERNPEYHSEKYLANKPAHQERNRRRYQENRDAIIARTRAYKVLRDYGLTMDEVDALKASQGGQCAICGEGKKFAIDHDHGTGVVRGILCDDCNVGLGRFKDDPRRLMNAIAYLANGHMEAVA